MAADNAQQVSAHNEDLVTVSSQDGWGDAEDAEAGAMVTDEDLTPSWWPKYHKSSNISHTFVDNHIADHSDVVGTSPVGAAPTTSSFLT